MQPVVVMRGDDLGVAMGQLSKTWRDAAATALNRTAEDALAEQRAKMRAQFIVRVPNFDLPPVQLPASWRAKPDRLFVQIALGSDDGPSTPGGRRVQIFSKFGTDQRKIAKDVLWPLAIPTQAIRPDPTSLVPRGLYPKNLRVMTRYQVGPGGLDYLRPKAPGTRRKLSVTVGSGASKLKLKQQDRTFILPNAFGSPAYGIWERIGPAKRDIRMIWLLRTSEHIPKRMSFEDDVKRVIDSRLKVNFDGAFQLSLAGTLWGKAR